MTTRSEFSRDPRGFNRRKFIIGAGAAAAVTTTTAVALPTPASAGGRIPRAIPIPEPINGGVRLDPADPASLIHWLLPGPEGATTQVIGLEAMGLDVDPSTVGNFKGSQAFAVVAGTAKANDGKTYDCEFDVRAMEGTYVAADGVERRGAFAFMWVDLFVLGSGASGAPEQVVDMQPGIMPNGLFWTAQIAGGDFRMNRRTAVLSVTAYPLVQTYQAFSTAAANPGLVTVRVRWTATGEAVERGKGADVPADDQAAFLGLFSDARATATVEGYSPGLNFKSNNLSSDGFYANMGRMHNGAYL